MKYLKYVFILITITLMSCIGDKKTVLGTETGTDEFENKQFSGNKLTFSALSENLCEYIDMNIIYEQFKSANVTEAKADPNRRFMGKYCNFSILFDKSMPTTYSRGMISVVEDKGEAEINWREQWEFRKKSLNSAAYVLGIGKAAIWIGKQRKLEVKMDGYTIFMEVPAINGVNDPNAKQHDYKTSAIKILKNSKLL